MRTVFNNIISEKNLEPKLNTEYIYNLDMTWSEGTFESIPINKGIIVENVKQLNVGNYSFNIKGKDEVYWCSYGWAFIENTERNIELIEVIDKEEIILKDQKLKITQLQNKLDRLYK